jgi:hypothetical protein
VAVFLIIIRLEDFDGNPLYGKEVHFYVSSDGLVWHYIGYAVTDEEGYVYVIYETNSKTWFKAEFRGDEDYELASEVVMWDPMMFVCRPLVVTNVEILDKVLFCVGRYGVTVFVLAVAFLLLVLLLMGGRRKRK